MQHPGTVRLPPLFPQEALFSFLYNLRTNRAESSSCRLPNINLVHKQPLSITMELPGDADALHCECQRAELTADQSKFLGGSPGIRGQEAGECQMPGLGWGEEEGKSSSLTSRLCPLPTQLCSGNPPPQGPLQCLSLPPLPGSPLGMLSIPASHIVSTPPPPSGWALLPSLTGGCDQSHSDAVIPETLGSPAPLPSQEHLLIRPEGYSTLRAPAMPSESPSHAL